MPPLSQHATALGGIDTYVDMVRDFVRLGYTPTTFAAFSPQRRDLLLRHDVDVDLDTAVAMARTEQEHGWRSTFFMLLTADAYDLASPSGRAALRDITAYGHAVGLHFDPAVYESPIDIEKVVAQECAALEQLLGQPVDVVAPHRPSKVCPEWLGWDHAPAGRMQAYHPRFFHEAGYVSDGAGSWSYGHPLDHPKVAAGLGIQILTHPHLWAAN